METGVAGGPPGPLSRERERGRSSAPPAGRARTDTDRPGGGLRAANEAPGGNGAPGGAEVGAGRMAAWKRAPGGLPTSEGAWPPALLTWNGRVGEGWTAENARPREEGGTSFLRQKRPAVRVVPRHLLEQLLRLGALALDHQDHGQVGVGLQILRKAGDLAPVGGGRLLRPIEARARRSPRR